MFVHLSLHHPRPGAEESLIESMHRYGDALQGAQGSSASTHCKDEAAGFLAGLAIWATPEAMRASAHLAREAMADDPFDQKPGDRRL